MDKSQFHPVRLDHATRLINHGPTVLITSAHAGRRNVMAVAWSMPVNFAPPQVAVVIDSGAYTRELIAASGTFGICIPGRSMIDLVYAVGNSSGRNRDKFAEFGIEAIPSLNFGVPLIESGCSAWLECRVLPESGTETEYDTLFAEVIAAAADPRIFSNGRWSFRPENAGLHTVHYLGGETFVVPGDIERAVPANET